MLSSFFLHPFYLGFPVANTDNIANVELIIMNYVDKTSISG